jgi:peptide/nickel transport system permease protein
MMKRGWRERERSGVRVAALVLLGLLSAAALAPVVAPYGYDTLDLAHRRAGPSTAHWFGTDDLGRDLLTRVLHGARVSLAIGLGSAALAGMLGTTLGAVAGAASRRVDDVLMRFTDAMLAIPRLPLLLLVAAFVRPSVPLLVVLVSAVSWMECARAVRPVVRALTAEDFVSAARALGAAPSRVLVRHILPGIVPVAAVATTLAIARGILLESAISFFGVGVQPPLPSWGNMLWQAQSTMASAPWLAIFPGVAIFVTVLTCNAIGDAFTE